MFRLPKLLLALLVSGMVWGGDTDTVSKLHPVTLQLKWLHQFQFAGYYAALEQGYYRNAGLDVRIREAQPGMDVVQQVLQGAAEYGVVSDHQADVRRLQGYFLFSLGILLTLSLGSLYVYRLNRRLKNSEQRYRTIYQETPTAFVLIDLDNRITGWNRAAERIFGWSSGDALGQDVFGLLVPGDQKNQVQTVLRQAQNAHNTNSLNWNLTRQGRNILCEWRNAPLYDHCGRISGIACLATDVTERQQMQEYLEHHAHYDALTELPNRLLFFDRLEQAAIQARRYRSGFALLYIDLDEFKAVNDRFGHAAGDEVLKETVRRMRAAVRESDTVARLGGDEFIILLVEMAKPEDAEAMALKLVETINQPILLAEGAAVVGAAIGIALYPRDGEGVQELLNKADNAMYVAKGCGKNTYRWCLPG